MTIAIPFLFSFVYALFLFLLKPYQFDLVFYMHDRPDFLEDPKKGRSVTRSACACARHQESMFMDSWSHACSRRT